MVGLTWRGERMGWPSFSPARYSERVALTKKLKYRKKGWIVLEGERMGYPSLSPPQCFEELISILA